MLELIRDLRSIQDQLESLRLRMVSLVPQVEDKLALICSQLQHLSFAVTESKLAAPYIQIVPGCWLGYAADSEQVILRQHIKSDVSEPEFELSLATPENFQSSWLTMEFLLGRADVI